MASPTTRAASTSGTTHRLVVPIPEGGWLAPRQPTSRDERLELGEQWREQARRCAEIAGLPKGLGPVALLAVVRLGSREERGIRHHTDAILVLRSVELGLVRASVLPSTDRDVITYEEVRLGGTDPSGGQLILHLREVGAGG